MIQYSKYYEFRMMFDDNLIRLSNQKDEHGLYTHNAIKALEELRRRHGDGTIWGTAFGVTWVDEDGSTAIMIK